MRWIHTYYFGFHLILLIFVFALPLTEVYSALGAGSTRLALMDIRALLEQVMIEQVGDLGNFAENLAAFEKGCISSVQRASLFRIIESATPAFIELTNPH
jgi:hypothetical protein